MHAQCDEMVLAINVVVIDAQPAHYDCEWCTFNVFIEDTNHWE